MVNSCAKCANAVSGSDFVTCLGYCGGMFHIGVCSSGVSRTLLAYFQSHKKNLFWMCDKCADLFNNSHFRSIQQRGDEKSPLSTLTTAIDELRSEITKLNTKPVLPFSSTVSNAWPSIEQRRSSKRPRDNEPVPRASDSCLVGCKQPNDNVVTIPVYNDSSVKKFWLYLSRIKPDVTNDAVCAMVKANLEIDTAPDVVRLVRKEKDTSTLTFISFKIGLDPSLKTKALNPASWPEGLLFREFENFEIPKFRLPLKSRKPWTPLPTPIQSPLQVTPIMD